MSDASSSDDEPCFSSPDASAGDDADDRTPDVFKFKAQRFSKQVDSTKFPISSSKHKKKTNTTDDKLRKIVETNKRREKQNSAIATGGYSSSSSDDDEIEILSTRTPANVSSKITLGSSNHPLRLDEPLPERAHLPKKPKATVLFDSDSDNDAETATLHAMQNASVETKKLLMLTKKATTNLRLAQNYHAEDIKVAVPAPIVESANKRKFNADTTIVLDGDFGGRDGQKHLGSILRFTCRAQVTSNGSKRQIDATVFKLREHDKLSNLLNKYLQQNSLPSTANCAMVSNGHRLDPSKTPTQLELEDEDVIDISITVSLPSGPKINLRVRRKIGKKFNEVQIRADTTLPFAHSLAQYIAGQKLNPSAVFQFDGERLALQKTPNNYDMEDDDLIDVA